MLKLTEKQLLTLLVQLTTCLDHIVASAPSAPSGAEEKREKEDRSK